MSCYHPLSAVDLSPVGASKADIKFVFDRTAYPPDRWLDLPCGRCIGCRLDYSREWANRCMLELGYHESSYFCTFTYDDAHLPKTYSTDPQTGECLAPVATLRRRDAQLLLKRIRKRFSDCQIRFFGSGEYGAQSLRPHYHIILFGLQLDDLFTYKKGDKVGMYYNSSSLQSCWPFGYVVVSKVTWDTCAYVARYVLKKRKVSGPDAYTLVGIEPEFSMCSRRPGIGRRYYEDHPDLFRYRYINVPGEDSGTQVPPPNYFKRLLRIDNPDLASQISLANRHAFKMQESLKKGLTDLDYYDILQLEEQQKQKRILSLRRNIV